MACVCENHLEHFTCSGIDCHVCVLSEENYIENPAFPEEKYCLNCAMKKAGFTKEELDHLIVANTENDSKCNDKSC